MSPLGLSYADRLRSGAAKPTLGGPFDTRTRTVGGAYGNPGATPLPMERGPMPQAVPLGMAPSNQVDFQQQMQAQNRVGNTTGALFGGALPTMISTAAGPRPGFMSGPQDPSPGRTPESDAMAAQNLLGRGAAMTSVPGQFRGSASMMNPPAKEGAAPTGRSIEERYHSRGLLTPAERGPLVMQKAQNRAEARRARRGLFTPEEQLNRADPAAYQARVASEANSKAQADRFSLGLASQERIATDRNQTARDIAKSKLDAELGQSQAESGKPGLPTLDDLKVMDPQEARDRWEAAGGSPGEFNKLMEQKTGRPGNYWQYPGRGKSLWDVPIGGVPGSLAITQPEAPPAPMTGPPKPGPGLFGMKPEATPNEKKRKEEIKGQLFGNRLRQFQG